MKLENVTCIIDRAAHLKIEKTVPAWEVPVLNAIFGAGNVSVIRTETYDGTFDPEVEWHAMQKRYQSATDENAEKIFPQVYPNVDSLDRAFERATEKKKRKQSEERAAA